MITRGTVACLVAVGAVAWSTTASAATLSVGSGAKYTTIAAAMADAQPGDVVEVAGDQTYNGTHLLTTSGTKAQPITLRGKIVNGKRPILRGVGPGQYDNMVVLLGGNHFVMESFEVIGGSGPSDYCIVHKADDVTLRDLVVHECPHQGGLVSTDDSAGSITLEYSEFYKNGSSDNSHQLYMASDEVMYPGSRFRMQYCYVHDGTGGNNVKSRSERNEIYYNWIEGATYHELDLIGPDTGDMATAREDSDVVGNVLVKTSEWRIARIGGDGSGNTAGRYRFVNNTMILGPNAPTVISLQQTVETLEMYNNVIYRASGPLKITEIDDQEGVMTTFFGSNNWVSTGATNVPMAWTNTTMGGDPGWVDPTMNDYRPKQGSALVDIGTMTTAATGALAFPSPLALPTFSPPQRRLIAIGAAEPRIASGAPDLGAYEQTAVAPGAPPPPSGTDPGPGSGSGSGSGNGSGGNADDSGGCGCHATPRGHAAGGVALVALGIFVTRRRRAKRANSA